MGCCLLGIRGRFRPFLTPVHISKNNFVNIWNRFDSNRLNKTPARVCRAQLISFSLLSKATSQLQEAPGRWMGPDMMQHKTCWPRALPIIIRQQLRWHRKHSMRGIFSEWPTLTQDRQEWKNMINSVDTHTLSSDGKNVNNHNLYRISLQPRVKRASTKTTNIREACALALQYWAKVDPPIAFMKPFCAQFLCK